MQEGCGGREYVKWSESRGVGATGDLPDSGSFWISFEHSNTNSLTAILTLLALLLKPLLGKAFLCIIKVSASASLYLILHTILVR